MLNGYPGTIAGTWQRLGRAGRRDRPALGVLVAGSEPLDQYIVRNPAFFLDAPPEEARIDPDQLLILLDHVRCAAFELPFTEGERFGREDLAELLAWLEESREPLRAGLDPNRTVEIQRKQSTLEFTHGVASAQRDRVWLRYPHLIAQPGVTPWVSYVRCLTASGES